MMAAEQLVLSSTASCPGSSAQIKEGKELNALEIPEIYPGISQHPGKEIRA